MANRGEIARRIMRTARAMGITTVAVYSDADARSPHVAEADLAVRLPGDSPADTYLRSALILDAASRTGADAIHPGYGFLSESGTSPGWWTGPGSSGSGPRRRPSTPWDRRSAARRSCGSPACPPCRRSP